MKRIESNHNTCFGFSFLRITQTLRGECENNNGKIWLHYSFVECPLGEVLVASTSQGICIIEPASDRRIAAQRLRVRFPYADCTEVREALHQDVLAAFHAPSDQTHPVRIHLIGTAFQLNVWNTLAEIPWGKCVTYKDVAIKIHQPKAVRAVGTAVGQNPVLFLIPCHRVIRSDGRLGQYRLGETIKKEWINREKVF